MSERKINLEEIANSSGVYRSLMDEQQKHATLSLMLEFGKQLLELATENAEIVFIDNKNVEQLRFTESKGDINILIDKQSILDTIKQVEC